MGPIGGMMANEFYTLIVVPHAKPGSRKLQVSVKLMKWAGGVSAAMSLAIVGMLIHYTWISVEVHELRRLRFENQELLAKTHEDEQNATKLQNKMDYLH